MSAELSSFCNDHQQAEAPARKLLMQVTLCTVLFCLSNELMLCSGVWSTKLELSLTYAVQAHASNDKLEARPAEPRRQKG